MARFTRDGGAEPKRMMTWVVVRRTFSGWVVYFIFGLYIASTLGAYVLFSDSPKKEDGTPRWNLSEANAIPVAGSALTVIAVWFWALLSDDPRTRRTLICSQIILGLVPCIAMSQSLDAQPITPPAPRCTTHRASSRSPL